MVLEVHLLLYRIYYPVFSGIHTNIYISSEKVKFQDVQSTLKDFYKDEYFINIKNNKLPKLSEVQNTNKLIISVFENKSDKTIIIMSLLDNLIKGAAGQAIQNMNLMFGFNERESLI